MTDGLDDPEMLHAFFFESPFGSIEIVRLVLLAALVATSGRSFAVAAAIGGTLLVSQAWLGHAAEGGHTLAGAAMWLGGLPSLALAIREGRKVRIPTIGLLLRFSTMAIVAVAIVVASGIVNAGVRAGGNIGALISSPYGEVLAAKLGLVAMMLTLAAYNRVVVMPRIARGGAADGLAKTIVVEMALGVAVLGVAALLGVTPPPA